MAANDSAKSRFTHIARLLYAGLNGTTQEYEEAVNALLMIAQNDIDQVNRSAARQAITKLQQKRSRTQ